MNTTWLSRSPAEQAADIARIRVTVATLSVTVASEAGDLTVTAGPGGAVTALELTSRALRRASGELSDVLIDTMERASRAAQDQLAAQLAEITGRTAPSPTGSTELPAVATTDSPTGSTAPSPDQLGFDDAGVAQLSAITQHARDQLERYQLLRESLADSSAAGVSADGSTTVTLRADGRLQLIEIDPRALRNGPEAVATAVLDALQSARVAAARLMAERTQELLGGPINVPEMVEKAIAANNTVSSHSERW